MIQVKVKFYLQKPYAKSSMIIEFANLWGFIIVSLCTASATCDLLIPWNKFKEIFHENPQKKEYPIPQGAELFSNRIIVTDILTNGEMND